MPTLQRAGGSAAIFLALSYTVGFAAMGTLLDPGPTGGGAVADRLAFVLGRQGAFQATMLLLYLLAGVALVVLAAGLHARLQPQRPQAMAVATPLGHIWAGLLLASGMVALLGLEVVARLQAREPALAGSAWVAVGLVQDALGGGIEFVGGAWMLLVNAAAWRQPGWPRALAGLGAVLGVVGILTAWPGLRALAAVFGLGQIVWFAWAGAVLLRPTAAPAPRS